MEFLIEFFNHPFFMVFGGILALLTLVGMIFTGWLVLKGIIPVWYRLGLALSERKIAIFADEKFYELKDVLVDSGIFAEKNIIRIEKSALKKAANISVFLIHYSACRDFIDDILILKKDPDAMLVYSPQEDGFIDKEVISKLNAERNTLIVNFRGRLLNDVLTSLITTSFSK